MKCEILMEPEERQPHQFSEEFENWLEDIQDDRHDEPEPDGE